jgi:hypothetical protein
MNESIVLVTWQLDPVSGTRTITEASITEFRPKHNEIHFLFVSEEGLEPTLPVYFYVENDELIFKTSIQEMTPLYISTNLPLEIQFLEEAEVKIIHKQPGLSTYWASKRMPGGGANVDNFGSDFVVVKSMSQRSSRDQEFLNQEWDMPSVDEEDKLFADKRESPRARPKADKWVKVRKAGERGVGMYKLFDLSRGGMSFIVIGESDYPKGSEINVTGFETFDLDDPLVGKVMSLRPLDESQIEFKVGVKFNEGQD